MNKKEFEKKLTILSHKYQQTKDNRLIESIENEFQDYLKNNPHDSENWIRFAIFLKEEP